VAQLRKREEGQWVVSSRLSPVIAAPAFGGSLDH
jgi:hypothetical protein